MATKTLGTTANNSLTAMLVAHGGMAAADIATINQGIKYDGGPEGAGNAFPGGWDLASGGLLYIPRRGVLKVMAGDYVAIDSQGWPVLVSANSIANAAWTHS